MLEQHTHFCRNVSVYKCPNSSLWQCPTYLPARAGASAPRKKAVDTGLRPDEAWRAFSSGMSRWWTTKIWARRSWRLKCAESVASDIASDFEAGLARRALMA